MLFHLSTYKKRAFPIIFSFLALACLGYTPLLWTQNPQNLTDLEYKSAYGNKTFNLKKLKDIIAGMDLGTQSYVEVPTFYGLSHDTIQQFISPALMEKINQYWQAFVKDNNNLQALNDLETTIRWYFFDLNTSDYIFPPDLLAFLDYANKNNLKLMVRSTGAEDTKEVANAGGNKSIANVEPNLKQILNAIGEVVSSYFSAKSIGQRLAAGDPTVFDMPRTPVLLQVMIGENPQDSTTIPTSGVLFSQEAEGNTKGLTQIQATYGHNEAVVNGLLPVDTFYVTPAYSIYSVIRKKEYRLAPIRRTLEKAANDNSKISQPCLSKEIIIRLKKIADHIQRVYGYPVDIEFVVQNNNIYLIQARPIILVKQDPSYLDYAYTSALPVNSWVQGTTITNGNNAVAILNNQQQALCRNTINVALDDFLKNNKKDTIKAILVGQMAPSTSHEATTFRSNQKIVIYTEKFKLIEKWIDEGKTVLIDPQSGRIALFNPTDRFPNIQNIIKKGWASHPVPTELSLMNEFAPRLNQEQIAYLAPQENYPELSIQQLIEKIKYDEPEDAIRATRSLITRACVWGKQEINSSDTSKNYAQELNKVLKETFGICYELIQLFESSSASNIESFKYRLFLINMLNACIDQASTNNTDVNTISFNSLLKEYKQDQDAQALVNTIAPGLDKALFTYVKFFCFALTEKTKIEWVQFVKELPNVFAQNNEYSTQFMQMMSKLSTYGLMQLWLNSSFIAQAKQATISTGVIGSLDALLNEFNASIDFLEKLYQKNNDLKLTNVTLWQTPSRYTVQWPLFRRTILKYFYGTDFSTEFKKGLPLGKSYALIVMNNVVDTFDKGIKEIKASSLYGGKTKVELIQRMLRKYFKLLKQWCIHIAGEPALDSLVDKINFSGRDDNNNNIKTGLVDYLDTIERLVNQSISSRSLFSRLFGFNKNSYNKDLLAPSAQFNVAGACLGSKANWERSIGDDLKNVTLEDTFTLIHQNLLVVLSTLTPTTSLAFLELPPLLAHAKRACDNIYEANLIGISYQQDSITYYYNRPLRNHSCTFQLAYNTKDKALTISLQFIGEARSRWADIARESTAIAEKEGYTVLEKPIVDETRGKVGFTWLLETEAQATSAISHVNSLIQSQ